MVRFDFARVMVKQMKIYLLIQPGMMILII